MSPTRIYRFSRLLALLLTLLPSLARAGHPTGAPDVDPDTEIARRHFKAGSTAYEIGRAHV